MTRQGIAHSAREVFLTTGALLGVVCILATIAGAAFGIKPLVFRSGSMSPTIHTGDLAVSRTVEASDLRRGDVVSVVTSSGSRVTHRLVNVTVQGDARQLTLKGDANKKADAEVFTVTRVEKVWFHIPKAGYVVHAAMSPAGVFLLGLYVAGMLTLVLRRRSPDDPGGSAPAPPRRRGGARKAGKSDRSRAALRGPFAIVAAAVIAVASPAAAVPWTKPVTISGTTLSAGTLPPAANFRCGDLGLLSVKFDWDAVAGATSYTLYYGAGGAMTTLVTGATTKTVTTAISGGTAWVVANKNYGSTTWSSVNSNTRTYTVAVLSVCR